MRLLKLKYKNLFSLGEGEVNLGSRGLTLVTGYSNDEGSSNGAGKSSLANKAILWTLFGETAGGLRADNVLNRHGKKKCFGELTFIGTDNNEYKIERCRPSKLSLFKGDIDISTSTMKATQELINKLLGVNFKAFIQTSFFGQGKSVHYPSLMPKEQKLVLEKILPIDEVNEWAEYTQKQIKTLKPKLSNIEIKLREANTEKEATERFIRNCGAEKDKFEEERKLKIANATATLNGVKEKFSEEYKELKILKNKINDIDTNKIEKSIEAQEALRANILIVQEENKKTWFEATENGRQWGTELNSRKRQRQEMKTDVKCPTCLRDYDETTVEAVKKNIENQDQLIKEAADTYNKCTIAIDYYKQIVDKNNEMVQKADNEIMRLQDLSFEKERCQQRGEAIVAKIEAAEAGAKTILEEAQKAENPYNSTFERLNKELKEIKTQIKETGKVYKILKEELEHLRYWYNIYWEELKLKLFEDACPFLDAQTEYHLNQLKNPQLHCEFSTIKRLANGKASDEFNVNVWSETGGQGFDSLSGGEQQIVNFAIGLALADLAGRVSGVKSNFLIMDEPFTELDDKNSEAVVEYLTAEIENGKDTILLISNEESLKGLIHNRIHIVKSNGVSNVSKE